MIGSTRSVRVYAYAGPVDMRKGFDGLAALVRLGLDRDPTGGDMFLFVSRSRIRAKVLVWDGTGLCLYAKRLERGRFASLWRGGQDEPVELTQSELQLFLEGCMEVGKRRLSPPEVDPQEAFVSSSYDVEYSHARRADGARHREAAGRLSSG